MYNVPKNKFGIIESDIKITNKEFNQVERILELIEPEYQYELKKVVDISKKSDTMST